MSVTFNNTAKFTIIFSPLVTHQACYSGLGRDDDDVADHLKHSFFFFFKQISQHNTKTNITGLLQRRQAVDSQDTMTDSSMKCCGGSCVLQQA